MDATNLFFSFQCVEAMRRRRIRQTLTNTSYVYLQWGKENGGLSDRDGLIPEIVKSEQELEKGEGEEEEVLVVVVVVVEEEESKNSILLFLLLLLISLLLL